MGGAMGALLVGILIPADPCFWALLAMSATMAARTLMASNMDTNYGTQGTSSFKLHLRSA
jgi:hypothetical protein